MVDFKFLLFCKRAGYDLSHHTDCMDNDDGKCCKSHGGMCDDFADCPIKQKRKELARHHYEELRHERM